MSCADRPHSAKNGFTLVEMLVALAVFGLAALALLRLEGATLRNSAILQDRLIGQIVARNIAVEVLTDPQAPAYGATAGVETDTGRNWRWTRNILHAPDPGLQRIDILVTDDSGHTAGALTIFRAAPL